MIKAPFNFIPLADRVFYPGWANEISHDVPFADGVSGVIDLTITAQTPIFVKDPVHTDGEVKLFNHTEDGRYFIPGTSVKGCIRNVLEIMSFGKMHVGDKTPFSYRDWNNTNLYEKSDFANGHCGWLKIVGDKYVIEDHGKPLRINHKRIDEWLKCRCGKAIHGFEFYFLEKEGFNFLEDTIGGYAPQSAAAKYYILEKIGLHKSDLENLKFEQDTEYNTKFNKTRYLFDEVGSVTGTLVLTGQPRPNKSWDVKRDKDSAKFYEFIFPSENKNEYTISKQMVSTLIDCSEKATWDKCWKDELENGRIPVFFRIGEGKEKVKDLGLAQLYRLQYQNSSFDIEENRERSSELKKNVCVPDLAECIFGYISESGKANNLKGRIQFSHFFTSNPIFSDRDYIFTLNSPKPSYYPMYIKQTEINRNGTVQRYNTYNDGLLAGRKRYELRTNVYSGKLPDEYNQNTDTKIRPLNHGTQFCGQIYFHNLKHCELGALLAALTFFDTEGCYHQIGQAKPYGFGRVTLNFSRNVFVDNSGKEVSWELAMSSFEYCLNLKDFKIDHKSISQLLSMAHNIQYLADTGYMTISDDNNDSEYARAIENHEYLLPFTDVHGYKNIVPESKVDRYKQQFDINALKELILSSKNLIKTNNLNECSIKINEAKDHAEKNALDKTELVEVEKLYNSKQTENDKIDQIASYIKSAKNAEISGNAKEELTLLKKALELMKQVGMDSKDVEERIETLTTILNEKVDISNLSLSEMLAHTTNVQKDFDKWYNKHGNLSVEDLTALTEYLNVQNEKLRFSVIRDSKYSKTLDKPSKIEWAEKLNLNPKKYKIR